MQFDYVGERVKRSIRFGDHNNLVSRDIGLDIGNDIAVPELSHDLVLTSQLQKLTWGVVDKWDLLDVKSLAVSLSLHICVLVGIRIVHVACMIFQEEIFLKGCMLEVNVWLKKAAHFNTNRVLSRHKNRPRGESVLEDILLQQLFHRHTNVCETFEKFVF